MLADQNPAVDNFMRAWQLSIRLVHAHIRRVFEFHGDDAGDKDVAFYSMQYIDGPDLSVLAAGAPADVLAPIGLLASALGYAHQKGVVHRDIKASNVLLDANGAPYLIDFGSATSAGDRAGGPSQRIPRDHVRLVGVHAVAPNGNLRQRPAGHAPANANAVKNRRDLALG